MLATINSVTFNGIDILRITIEEQITSGMPSFKVFGLADKVVAESRKRVRTALRIWLFQIKFYLGILVKLWPIAYLKGSHDLLGSNF